MQADSLFLIIRCCLFRLRIYKNTFKIKKNLQEQLSALTFKFKINWKRKIGINKHSKSVPIQNVSYIKSIVHKVPTTTSTYVREVRKVTDGKSDLK